MRREVARTDGAPIRLVQFVRSLHYGGTEGQLVELLRGLPRGGYELSVAVIEAAGPHLERVCELGHLPRSYPLQGSAISPNTGRQILRLARWLRAQRTELVHAHDFYSALVAVPAAKLARCKVIAGRLDLAHWHDPLQRAALAGTTRLADHVVANAEAIREMLITRERLPGSRISVVRNGIDLGRFDRRQREGLQAPLPEVGDAPVVIHVANMTHAVKRQEDLIKAMSLARQAGRKIHAFLVGAGVRQRELERMTAELGLEDRVHFLGHRADVPAVYGRATMGVLCSSAEGLSNAVIEGMAARLPMVVTRVGGNPELVADAERGRVVERYQPEALYRAIVDVLRDPERARRMGQAGRAFVERELTLQRMVERHDQVYRSVLGRSTG
jgi:L-malate glycosyltransferase